MKGKIKFLIIVFLSILFLHSVFAAYQYPKQIKTVQYFLGQNTTKLDSAMHKDWQTGNINVTLPETNKVVRSAWVEARAMKTQTAGTRAYNLTFNNLISFFRTSTTCSNCYLFGENLNELYSVTFFSNVTQAFNNFPSRSVVNFSFIIGDTGANPEEAINHNAILFVTYEHDESEEQINTVIYPLPTDPTGVSSFNQLNKSYYYNASINELNQTLSSWFQIYGGVSSDSSTSDIQYSTRIDANAFSDQNYTIETSTLTDFDLYYLAQPTGFQANTGQQLDIRGISCDGADCTALFDTFALGGELYVTYNYSNSTTRRTKTVGYFLGQNVLDRSTTPYKGSTVISLPEYSSSVINSIDIKAVWAKIYTSYESDTLATLKVAGSIDDNHVGEIAYNLDQDQAWTGQHIIIYNMTSAASAINSDGSAIVNVNTTWSTSDAGSPVGIELWVTYEYEALTSILRPTNNPSPELKTLQFFGAQSVNMTTEFYSNDSLLINIPKNGAFKSGWLKNEHRLDNPNQVDSTVVYNLTLILNNSGLLNVGIREDDAIKTHTVISNSSLVDMVPYSFNYTVGHRTFNYDSVLLSIRNYPAVHSSKYLLTYSDAIQLPISSAVQINQSMISHNENADFGVIWTQGTLGFDLALSQSIFSIDMGTGTFENISTQLLSESPKQHNVTTTISALPASIVRWQFFAQDYAGNWNATDIQSFNVSLLAASSGAGCGYVNTQLTVSAKIKIGNGGALNGDCFIINASNLLINGNNNVIEGNNSGSAINITISRMTGVSASLNLSNITIKNFLFSNFSNGIYIENNNTDLSSINAKINLIYNKFNETFENDAVKIVGSVNNINISFNNFTQFLSSTNNRLVNILNFVTAGSGNSNGNTINNNNINILATSGRLERIIATRGSFNNITHNNISIPSQNTGRAIIHAFAANDTIAFNVIFSTRINSALISTSTGETNFAYTNISFNNLTISPTLSGSASAIELGTGNFNKISNNIIRVNGGDGSKATIDMQGSQENLINNNNLTVIDSSSGTGDVVNVNGISGSHTITNNLIFSIRPSRVLYLRGNNNITDNNITLSESQDSTAIELEGNSGDVSAPTSNIFNNTLILNGTSVVGMNVSHNSLAIRDNEIHATGTNAFGLFVKGSSNNITGNNITTSGSGAHALEFDSTSQSNNLTNNNFTTYGNNAFGMELKNTSNNLISNNIIKTLGNSHGIVLQSGAINNNFTSNTINITQGYYDIYINGSGNSIFTNNTMGFNIFAYNGNASLFNITFINSSVKLFFENITIYYGDLIDTINNLSSFNNSIFLNASTTSKFNKAATITFFGVAYNNIGYKVLKDGTECSASICTKTGFDPVEFQVTGFSTYSTLLDTKSPEWFSPVVNKTSITQNDWINIGTYWTDAVGLDSYIFSIDNGTGTFENHSAVIFTGTSNSSNVTIQATYTGTVQWRFFANDSSNNINATSIQSFTSSSSDTQTTTDSAPTVGSSSGSGASNADVASQGEIISSLQTYEGLPTIVNIDNGIIDSLRIITENDESVSIAAAIVDRPTHITEASSLVYSYIEIEAGTELNKFISASISFSVDKGWLLENELSKGEIVLLRYNNDKWNELNTNFIKEDSSKIYYESSTPGFSLFAIGKKNINENKIDNTEDKEIILDEESESDNVQESLIKENKYTILISVVVLILFSTIISIVEKIRKRKQYDNKLLEVHGQFKLKTKNK